MNCHQLTIKYQDLQNRQARFRELLYDFQQMKTKTMAERDIVAKELKRQQEEIEEIIKDNFEFVFKELNIIQFSNWLKSQNLESKLDGSSFEALINTQEQFYQKSYGSDFKLDRTKIKIDKSRLPRIKAGLENGSANFPLLTAIPDNISEDEKQMTEAEFAYHKLLAPLKSEALHIWEESGIERWTNLTLTEVLKGYIPVEIADFDIVKLEEDWSTEIARIIDKKRSAPKIQAGKITLTFTDNRQNIPQDQKPINQDGQEVENKLSFIEMIKSKTNVLTPDQWITLAAQLYAKDKIYLSAWTWDWMMAVLENDLEINEPVSTAIADSDSDEVRLYSLKASLGSVNFRWRGAL